MSEITKDMPKEDQEKMIVADSNRLHDFWALRDNRMQSDRDVINLVKPEKQTTDKKLWMTNEPKVFFDTARSLVSLYPPRFKLPIPMNFKPEQKDKMNKAERLCIGVFRQLDSRIADTGGTSWLYELAYWLLGGWYATFTIVRKGSDGVEFVADLWDPINVYPEWDKDGLSACVRKYIVDERTSEAMAIEFQQKGLVFKYKPPEKGASYTVTNYWRRQGKKVFNAILMNESIVKPLTLQRNLNRIPIQIGAIGSPDRVSANWQERKGESIIAGARDMYDFQTEMMSLRAEIVEETAFPNIITKTRSGQPPVKEESIRGHGSVIPLRLEDAIDTMKHASSPQDVNVLEMEVHQMIQKATIPDSTYGGLPSVEISGFALSQFMAAIKYKLGPYVNAMKFATSRVMSEFLSQYRSGNYDKITLSTTNPYDLKRGMFYLEEFSKQDVPERIYVEVEIPISSQFDKTQAILNAVQAKSAGLLSRETLWENELDVQDAEQEKQRIIDDEVSADPFVKQLEILMRMRERVEAYKAVGMLPQAAALEKYILMLEQGAGIIQPNTGSQPAQPGVPPQQRPVEMTPQSPDIKNAMTNTPPTNPASAGRKGILFKPNGEVLM